MNQKFAVVRSRVLVDALKRVDCVREAHYVPMYQVAVACFGARPLLKARNPDQELTVFLEAECSSEFEAVIHASTAITAVGNSTGEATVGFEGGTTQITTDQVKLRCPTDINIEDYPMLKVGNPIHSLSIAEHDLCNALQMVRFAISREETRYYLNGVFLTNVNGEMAMVATDGHRLARHLMGLPYDGPDIIIPSSAVRILTQLLKREGERQIVLTIGVVGSGTGHSGKDTHAIMIDGGDWHLKSRCIDGTFPKWDVVMRKATDAIGETPAIYAKITQSQVSRLPRDNEWLPTIIDPAAGTIRVQNDRNVDRLEMAVKGKGEKFCFNARYLRQLVGAIGDVHFTGSAPGAPFVVKSKNAKTLVVQMPMKVPDETASM